MKVGNRANKRILKVGANQPWPRVSTEDRMVSNAKSDFTTRNSRFQTLFEHYSNALHNSWLMGWIAFRLGDGWGFWGGGHGYSRCHGRGIPVDCAPEV
jgi:hypothetical protein